MPTVYQSDSFWLDIMTPQYAAIDSTWANWGGTYEISTTESATPAVTGSLVQSTTAGVFNLRLNTNNAAWMSITVGTYKLMLQIANSTAGYREEKHYKLVVKTQGV